MLSVVIGATAILVGLILAPSSQLLVTRGGSAKAFDESIATFKSNDCTTPETNWNLGQTACATVTGATDERRIAWVAPNGSIARFSDSFTGTATDSYSIPTGPDPFAQVGTWSVTSIDASGVAFATAEFVVRDPAQASVNLSIGKFAPFEVAAGGSISYRVELINHGPDEAVNVVLRDQLPGDIEFVGASQTSGPLFICTTPPSGSTSGEISCTIANLPAKATATFAFNFSVPAGLPDGTLITNSASISSSTNELHTPDNSASSSATVNNATDLCTINCQGNVSHDNDPNQCGAIVTYSTPTTSGNCGSEPVICSPPSGSFYPLGATNVVCSTLSGGSCVFTVTVNDTRPPVQPTITCPPSVTVPEETPGSGSATVAYSAPTTTGNCVTTTCNPPSGTRFSSGTTTVTCTATDSAQNVVSCSFTVTVVGEGSCVLTCSSDLTQTAPAGQCGAAVTYAAPTTSGDCGTVSCSPASGSVFPVGSTVVSCTSSTGAGCEFAVTVVPASPPVITTCATNKNVAVDALCEAAIPNLLAEVTTTGCNVTVSQSPTAGSLVGPGAYTVTITAENLAGEATCTATVTVADVTPPVITTCPAASSTTVGGSCQAAVPDVVGDVTATDNCTPSGSLTVTQTPAAGTLVGAGVTTITVTVRDEALNSATCTTTFTVTGPQVSALGSAQVWVGLKNSDDVGTKFDLLAEVLRNGVVVGSGQINDVPGGSSGFNNAIQSAISLALSAPVGACTGDTLSFRLSVRVAASSGHTSGRARLWFNDSAANSRFSATVGGVTADYYLRDGFVLANTAGPGPKKTIDVLVNRNVGGNPFLPFGTWSKSL
jgi:uncharacterized repeat protein (TIGR01451 family)